MFLRTNAIFLSGTAISSSSETNSYSSQIIDVSSYREVQMWGLTLDGVAGTASLVVQNIDQSIVQGVATAPSTPFLVLEELPISEGTITSGSIHPICAKWAGVVLQLTSGSADPVTGSAVVSLALRS